MFDAPVEHALATDDRIISLDLSQTAMDGSQHNIFGSVHRCGVAVG